MFKFLEKLIVTYTITDLMWCVAFCTMILSATSILLTDIMVPTDETDNSIWHRSGVSIVVDHGTGMQYLKTSEGYLTPRLGVK